ncbi:MAG: 30S ribosomal protein S17 [bacterium]|nr:30S ribosomal protein S17 [bacterium]
MRKRLEGIVVSDKQQKTRIVEVERCFPHPKYKKYIRQHQRFACHSEENLKNGTRVLIEATRPLSKTKNWRIVKVI